MKRMLKYIILTITIIMSLGIFTNVYGEGTTTPGYFPPQPKDTVVWIVKPHIGMKLILNGNKVENVYMKLNGNEVNAKYDQKNNGVFYTPTMPLKPGTYKVDLNVEITGFKPLVQSWQFSISENAINSLPLSTDQQKKVLSYANEYRKKFKLEPLKLNSALNSAAMSHSNYMSFNKKLTHDEFSNEKGFTGVSPYNRAEAFGYIYGNVIENASENYKDYKNAVDELIDAPYHRLAWLNPFVQDFGYGFKDGYSTFDFGGNRQTKDQLIVYPLENQIDVKTNWDGEEIPNPLRFYEEKKNVGYPITISYFTNETIGKWMIEKVTLTDNSGNIVNTYINTPSKDEHLTNSIIVMPIKPLKSNTSYTVSIKAKVELEDKSVKAISKTWKFKTEKEQKQENKKSVFDDTSNHWAQNAIDDLAEKKIVSAKTGRLFKPDDAITRAQFTEFMINALDMKLQNYKGIFNDVKKDSKYSLYIEKAYDAGIIHGVGNSKFEPDRGITREEISTIITNVYEKNKKEKIKINDVLLYFTDRKKISDWALGYVKGAYKLQIIRGRGDESFDPQGKTTRAEAVIMIKNLLAKL
ncbi:S-layer homology domain-containing protein [Lutibacter sp. B2]|nr:S-layer homology domain-containing protein [Lutibacter sp. B2]